MITRFFALVLIIGLGIFAFPYISGRVVPPGTIGVRQVGFGFGVFEEGYLPEALPPGLYPEVRPYGLSRVHLIPSTLIPIHFSRAYKERGKGSTYWRPSLRVETFDKGEISIDVTVLAKFSPKPEYKDGKKIKGGPSDLIEQVGLTEEEWVNRIETDVKHHLRVELRQLTNAEFYNPDLREHKRVLAAQEALNETLRPLGVEVYALLLRRYTYEVDEVNRAIAEKNLQVQRERLSGVESSFAKVRAELDELSAELKAEIDVIQRTTPQKVRAIRSEGDLAYTKSEAEGNRLVAEASAEASKMKAEVFAENENAEIYLAQELAPLLSSLRGGVVSDIDPYDLNQWMEKLGLDKEGS